MQAYTYVSKGKFELREKPKPTLMQERDAIVKVTLASICSSDLHIKHGSVPRAVPGITVGHEMVGIVEEVGKAVTKVKPGDRVTVNVETFCGECFFCKKGYVNNCTDENGGYVLYPAVFRVFAISPRPISHWLRFFAVAGKMGTARSFIPFPIMRMCGGFSNRTSSMQRLQISDTRAAVSYNTHNP